MSEVRLIDEAHDYVWGDTVVVHGHTPAVRNRLTHSDELRICDGIDEYRAVCLDVGASSRPQISSAHFYRNDEQTMMQIHAFQAAEGADGK